MTKHISLRTTNNTPKLAVISKPMVTALLLLVTFFSCSQSLFAQGYTRPTEKGKYAGTYIEDFCYPQMPTSTYIPFLNTTYENGARFYSGIKGNGPDIPPVFLAAFWQGSMKDRVKPLYSGLTLALSHSNSEGSTGGVGGKFPFVKNNEWYKIVYKIWQPENNPLKHSYYGIWIKDIKANQWHTLAVFELPVISKGFKTLGGFIESISAKAINEVKILHRRFSYALMHGDEKWTNLDSLQVKAVEPQRRGTQGVYYHISQEGDVQIIKHTRNPDLLKKQNVPANGEATVVNFKQPETPPLGSFKIASVKSEQVSSGQLLVSYTLEDGSVPAVGGRIEIFEGDSNEPAKVGYFDLPYQTSVLVDSDVKNPRVRISLRSVLDQTDQSKLVPAVAYKQLDENKSFAGEVAPGLIYEVSTTGVKEEVKDLNTALSLPVIAKGTTGNINIYPASKYLKNKYAIKFRGYLKPEKTGLYQFHLRCTGDYRFSINGESVTVDEARDGSHPHVVTTFLEAGQLMPIEMDYFYSHSVGRGANLDILWSGPDFALQKIPSSLLFQSEMLDTFTLTHKADPSEGLKLMIQGAKTSQIKRVVYHCDEREIGSVESAKGKAGFPLQTLALYGKHNYSATVFMNDKSSTKTLPIQIENSAQVPGWEIDPKEINSSLAGFHATRDSILFSGIGRQSLIRKVTGDYTLKVHIASMSGGRLGKSIVSLRPWRKRFAINRAVQTDPRRSALLLPAHSRNFGGDSYGFSALDLSAEPGQPEWLALARQGKHQYTYYSYDGKKWYKLGEITDSRKPSSETISIMFESKHTAGLPLFNVKLDHITFENKFDSSLKTRSWLPEKIAVSKDTITGFLYLSEKKVLARTGNGLLASTDWGQNFSSFSGSKNSSEKATGFVRSIVTNPSNKNELYCAVIQRGKSKLLYSSDAGKTWTARKCPVKFSNNLLNSAAYGEIIAVHPTQGNIILIGGQDKNIYASNDRGKSWSIYHEGTGATSFVRFSNLGSTAKNDYLWSAQAQSEGKDSEHGNLLQWTCASNSKEFAIDGKVKPKKFATPATVFDIRISHFKGSDFSISTNRGLFMTFSGGRTFEKPYCLPDFNDRKKAKFIYDEPITAFDNYPRSTVEILTYCARLRNVQTPERIKMSNMKGHFPKTLPKGNKLNANEYVIDMIFSEDDREKLIISTTLGVYYTNTRSVSRSGSLEQGKIKQ